MKRCLGCGGSFEGGWQCPTCNWQPETREGIYCFAPRLQRDAANPTDFAALAAVEERHFWFRARNRLILWALERYFPNCTDILEVGCGTGYVLAGIRDAFPQATIRGSELAAEGLKFAAARLPGVELFQMDAQEIPFRDEFDVVGAFDVLEHIVDDVRVLDEMRQALRPGGGVIITVPQHSWLWSRADDIAGHVRRYTADELAVRLRHAGFSCVLRTSFVSLLLPLMVATRRLHRNEHEPHSREFEIGAVTNRLLERILDLECAAIRRGARFPVGGSLLAVAVRR
ncbi:MAG: class I SAM-dependent methyltransferase [Gammaproteobacteria bacterium]|nr:class I SAM-dependent methyltransferase [Gammaproteobacteria bacterium]MBI5616603.1 class I SAM-dependent methyltransferase [Gammaproteobacteria bacterium]